MQLHPDLLCDVLGISADFRAHQVFVFVGPLSWPDMNGAIKVATTLDPDCARIVFLRESLERLGQYVKSPNGDWCADFP